ncbi:MAG: bifunctional folylpolyglutamate synthase/dihydrofolate synthase [Bacteroidetes bacterium]|nr:bifunctional folylpolyglutamate synthase/dihydrofolate synthase [Bacteroidota bacterium]
MFHRIGAAAYKADLNNTIAICEILGNPQNKFKTIHVAGTNGKGSVSHFLASILQENGYKTGLYTSPHLKDFRERIRINGNKIPENKVIDFVTKHKDGFDKIKPSFFEWTVGLAFDYFAAEKVDIAVIETGLGGRLDSTNVITPELSVITNIGLDHTKLLGDTLEKIAFEKAGIIKNGIPVVIGETQDKTKSVFIEKAKKENAQISFADSHFKVLKSEIVYSNNPELHFKIQSINENHKSIFEEILLIRSPLVGFYQTKNIITVLMAVDTLNTKGFSLSFKNVENGIYNVIKNTELLGRWQKLNDKPLVICDTGHNVDGIKEIISQIELTPHNKLHWVIGFVNDKDVDSVLKLCPKDTIYYFCKASIPRALDENVLAEKAANFGLKGKKYNSVKEALEAAKKAAKLEDMIFVGGSTFVVAEII